MNPRHHKRHHADDDAGDERKPQKRNDSSLDEHRRRNKSRNDHSHRSPDPADRSRHSSHRNRGDRFDPHLRIKQEKEDENLVHQQRERSRHDERRRDQRRERDRAGGDYGLNTASIVKSEEEAGDKKQEEKQKPNFQLSGKLTEDTNTFRGVVIKYNEPQEAMKPKRRWRLYPFKGDTSLPVLHIHRQSAFLLGRDRKIADIPVDHPSCSKQHAVLQFRAMPYTRPDGTPGRRVRPYIIDLESANGTFLNNEKIEARKYYELKEKDVVKFGFSSREYVVLHDSVDLSEVTSGEDFEEA